MQSKEKYMEVVRSFFVCYKPSTISCQLVIYFSLFIFHSSLAQSDSSVRIIEAPGINRTVQKRIDYARYSNGVFPGYRIQVNFSQDRNDANRIRTQFIGKFPNLPTYLPYHQPYFKLYAGDFRTKLEAVRNLKMIKKDFPGAFVVKDKINPPAIVNSGQ